MGKQTYLFNGEVVNAGPSEKIDKSISLSLRVETFLVLLMQNKTVVEAIARDESLSNFLEKDHELRLFLLGGGK